MSAGIGVVAITAAEGLACGNPVSPRYDRPYYEPEPDGETTAPVQSASADASADPASSAAASATTAASSEPLQMAAPSATADASSKPLQMPAPEDGPK